MILLKKHKISSICKINLFYSGFDSLSKNKIPNFLQFLSTLKKLQINFKEHTIKVNVIYNSGI